MITYSAENVKMPKIRKRDTTAWIRSVAKTYGKTVGEVGYLFCAPMRSSSAKTTTRNCTVSSYTAYCTCAASTTRDPVNAK